MDLVVSFTADQISFEEHEKEKKELPESLAYDVESRSKGWTAIQRETEAEQGEAIALVHESATSHVGENQCYLRAMKECRDLVNSESNPLLFWRSCDFDSERAGKKLTKYWSARYTAFAEAAFRPLIQKGGALNDEDAKFFRSGFLRYQGIDCFGRAVMYMHRASTQVNSGFQTLRMLLYLCCVLGRDAVSQRHGIVFCSDTTSFDMEKFERKGTKKVMLFLQEACPFRIDAFHTIVPSRTSCVGCLTIPTVLSMMEPEFRWRNYLHFAGRPRDYLIDLEPFGMNREVLPPTLGGIVDLAATCALLDAVAEKESSDCPEQNQRARFGE